MYLYNVLNVVFVSVNRLVIFLSYGNDHDHTNLSIPSKYFKPISSLPLSMWFDKRKLIISLFNTWILDLGYCSFTRRNGSTPNLCNFSFWTIYSPFYVSTAHFEYTFLFKVCFYIYEIIFSYFWCLWNVRYLVNLYAKPFNARSLINKFVNETTIGKWKHNIDSKFDGSHEGYILFWSSGTFFRMLCIYISFCRSG